MNLGNPINIRLSLETEAIYEAEARARDVPLRTYLRWKLEERETIADEISQLRLALGEREDEGFSKSDSHDTGVLFEMLLLLRHIGHIFLLFPKSLYNALDCSSKGSLQHSIFFSFAFCDSEVLASAPLAHKVELIIIALMPYV